MKNQQHTPTPWINSGGFGIDVGNGDGPTDWQEIITDYKPEGCDFATVAYADTPENAERIVRAANHHDELVAALRTVITAAEIIDGQDSPPADDDVEFLHTSIESARELLAKLEGGAK